MITVRQRKFIPYRKIDNYSTSVVVYPKLFTPENMEKVCSKGYKIASECFRVGVTQLTHTLFDSKKNNIGMHAILFRKTSEMYIRNTKNNKNILVQGDNGTVIIIGAFVREIYQYTVPKNTIVFYEQNPLPYIYLSTKNRLKYRRKIRNLLHHVSELPMWQQCIQNYLGLDTIIGKGCYGNVYKSDISYNNFAVKLSKIKTDGMDKPYSNTSSSWYEVLLLKNLIKPIITKSICPNLPLLIDSFVCKKCSIIINEKKEQTPCVSTIVELAEGSLKDYIKDNKPSLDELHSALFQIMCGLHAIQLYGQIMNFDVKKENVLYYKVEKGGYWNYNVRGKNFYVPNYGYLFVLNDFGISRPMSPKFPIYRSKNDKTFRLGSRYGVVKGDRIYPLNVVKQVDAELDKVDSDIITWNNGSISMGANFRMERKSGKIIPLEYSVQKNIENFLGNNKCGKNSALKKFFLSPEIIPPFEFYNDTQDALRMFIGGKRTTQRGYHKEYNTVPKKLVEDLKPYIGKSESCNNRNFSTDPSQLLAGHFIVKYFSKIYGKRKGVNLEGVGKLASYIIK